MTSSSSSSNYHHTTVVGGCGSSMSMIPPRLTSPSLPTSDPSTSTAATARGGNSSGLSFVPHRRHYSGPSLSPSPSNTTTSRRKHRLTRRTYHSSNDCNYCGDTTNDSSSNNVLVASGRHHHHHHHHDVVNSARYHRAVAFMQHFRRLHSLDIIEEHEDDSTMTKMKSMKRSETTSCLTSLVDVEEEDEDHLHGGGGGGHGNEDGPHAASPASTSHYNFKNKRSRHLSFVEDDYVSDIDSIVVEEEEEPHHDEDDDRYEHHELHDNE
eukprot:CAMPEP_0113454502 /NCGR_PEP_ID=MMETSP0014_2-20120614/7894_1 /TAXON_ID=2857 /ORGANISM="Nitzschia sp." /LENGTH=266 /DNA_ID=CAMNT_0000345905 /DNA_START=428 /DNA_END=1228 /DNA_ORIENTATION=- /assembly_acc=CAM_ASM_000159